MPNEIKKNSGLGEEERKLLIYAEKGDLKNIKELISRSRSIFRKLFGYGININAQDINGWAALTYAAYKGHSEVVKYLAEHGVDINAQNKFGETALMYAAWNGDLESVKCLVEHGADVNAKDKNGKNAKDYYENERCRNAFCGRNK